MIELSFFWIEKAEPHYAVGDVHKPDPDCLDLVEAGEGGGYVLTEID